MNANPQLLCSDLPNLTQHSSLCPRYSSEFLERTELESLALDLDALRLQSLIICERILGVQHKDMIYKLMYRGAAYADSLQYQHCIDLWK